MPRRTVLKSALSAMLLLAGHSRAHANGTRSATILDRPAPIVQEQSFDYPGPSGGRTLTFSQFDTMSGTRTLVDVVLELIDGSTVVPNLQARNNVGADNTVRIELVGALRVTAPTNLVAALQLSGVAMATIGPLATYNFGELNDTGSATDHLDGRPIPDLFFSYTGQSTLEVGVSTSAGLSTTCSAPDCYYTVSTSYDQWRNTGRVRLTYTYVDSPSDVDPRVASRTFGLDTPRPNPSNVGALSYFPVHLPWEAQVEIELYDAGGRRIARSAGTHLGAGNHLVPWRTPRLASGTYSVRLRTSTGATSTARWTIIR